MTRIRPLVFFSSVTPEYTCVFFLLLYHLFPHLHLAAYHSPRAHNTQVTQMILAAAVTWYLPMFDKTVDDECMFKAIYNSISPVTSGGAPVFRGELNRIANEERPRYLLMCLSRQHKRGVCIPVSRESWRHCSGFYDRKDAAMKDGDELKAVVESYVKRAESDLQHAKETVNSGAGKTPRNGDSSAVSYLFMTESERETKVRRD